MYTSIETSTVIIQYGFCAKTVILQSISACVILLFCKKRARTPWRWRRQML